MKNTRFISVDVEADGPAPGLYSMIELGAVIVDADLTKTFHARLRPISDSYVQAALDVVGVSREQTLQYPVPQRAMIEFEAWILEHVPNRPMFLSDNNGFDWQFVNYYFWRYLGRNPFGHSSTNLGSLYKGMKKSTFENFKHLRKTKHTHNPVDDAIGNAEAFQAMINMGYKV
jgi:DNA polymerase III epsilon subunit-like protein